MNVESKFKPFEGGEEVEQSLEEGVGPRVDFLCFIVTFKGKRDLNMFQC